MSTLQNHRIYGSPPFRIVLVHGGPGAPGTLAPVARELSGKYGIVEALQTATSLEGQIKELKEIILQQCDGQITLIGHSWGAWLSLLFTQAHPGQVKKCVIIGAGPFEEKYLPQLSQNRLNKLVREDREKWNQLFQKINDPDKNRHQVWSEIDALIFHTDNYDPIPSSNVEIEMIRVDIALYQGVWQEAAQLRKSGQLLQRIAQIKCPVIALHGEYDPHPGNGVLEPLEAAIEHFRYISIPRCGHNPWLEKQAAAAFYELLYSLLPD